MISFGRSLFPRVTYLAAQIRLANDVYYIQCNVVALISRIDIRYMVSFLAWSWTSYSLLTELPSTPW